MITRGRSPRRTAASLVALVGWWLVVPAAARADSVHGVVVEGVEPGSMADKAGIKPGDILVEWTRLPQPSANPQPASGTLHSAFDWLLLEKEQAPRGTVQLSVRRDHREHKVDVAPGLWGLQVRPLLPPDRVPDYERAVTMIQNGEKQGIDGLEQVAAALTAHSDWPTVCWLSYRCGQLCADQGWWPQAQTAFQEALRRAENKDQPAIESLIWAALGDSFRQQSEYEPATKAVEHALELSEKSGADNLLAAEFLNALGHTAYDGGDLTLAETYFSKALAITEKLAPESLDVATSLNHLGWVAQDRGNLALADNYYSRALAIRENLAPDSLEVAACLNNLGIVAWLRGDLAQAETRHAKGLTITERLAPDSLDVAMSLVNLGIVAQERGDLAKAESYYSDGLRLTEEVAPNSLTMAMTLNNLGIIARERGDLALAETYYSKDLAITEKLAPDSLDVAMSMNNLGLVAWSRGDLAQAEAWLTKALAIKERVAPDSLPMAESLNNLGNVAHGRGDLAQAENYYSKALAIREKHAPDSLPVSESLNNLGIVARDRGDLAQAETWCSKALTIREKLAPGGALEADTLHALGALSERQHKLDQALMFMERAVLALEAQRGRWGGGSREAELFSEKFADYYRDLIDLKRRLNQDEDAFNLLERFRARAFLNLLAERDLDFAKDAPAELLREQKMNAAAYDKVQEQLAELSERNEPERVKALLERLTDLRHRQDDIAVQIKQSSPHLAALHYPEPLDLNGARQVLPADTLFLSFCVGPRATQLFALLNGELTATTIELSREELEERVRSYLSFLASPALRGDPIGRGQELYALLLEPVDVEIGKAKSLLICPDGPLHFLPFAALRPGPNRFLIEEMPLSYVLSATVYGELRKAEPPTANDLPTLVAFGDPVYPPAAGGEPADPVVRTLRGDSAFAPLPSTRQEVESICGLYDQGVQKFLGAQAREEEAKKLRGARVAVHFACHGFLDHRFPLDSGLALTMPEAGAAGVDNGLLQAWEIFESLRLETELVTLSACQTGLGTEMGGEGLIGLTRAFQYAGARAVLSTLWSVADETTAVLMTRFYGYLKEGHPKAAALRLAQLDFIRSSTAVEQELSTPGIEVAHPFYWACFVLNGE